MRRPPPTTPARDRRPAAHRVLLVPGFLASSDRPYFHEVEPTLQGSLDRLGLDAEVSSIRGRPARSLRERAAGVMSALARETVEGQRVHLVGHSTGGLDARLAITPGARLGLELSTGPLADRVDSIVTIATPHRGTPLASLAAGTFGGSMVSAIRELSAVLISEYLPAVARALPYAQRVGEAVDAPFEWMLRRSMVGPSVRGLSSVLARDRLEELRRLIDLVASTRRILGQLTPAAQELFDAAVCSPSRVREASVVIAAPPSEALGRDLYAVLHEIVARSTEPVRVPEPYRASLEAGLKHPLDTSLNDGVVPVASQVFGEVIFADVADHLEVIGYYEGAPMGDYLRSDSGFGADRFHALWDRVGRYLAAGDRRRDPAADAEGTPEGGRRPTTGQRASQSAGRSRSPSAMPNATSARPKSTSA